MGARHRHATSAEPGLAEELLYQALDGDGSVARLRNGALLAGFWFSGPDIEASTSREVARLSAGFNAVIRRMGSGWMVHQETIRREDAEYIPSSEHFADAVDTLIDKERRHQARHYRTDHALFFTYAPERPGGRVGGAVQAWLQGAAWREVTEIARQVLTGRGAEVSVEQAMSELRTFEQGLADVADGLSRAGLEVCRMTHRTTNNALLQALNYVVNGCWQPLKAPKHGWFLDVLLARELLGGQKVQHADKHVRVVTPLGFPEASRSAMLEHLCRLGLEFRWSSRFICQDYLKSRKQIDKRRREWRQKRQGGMAQMARNSEAAVNVDAVRRVQELDEAWGDLESGAVAYGHLTQVVVVTHADESVCEGAAREVLKAFQESGFTAVIERQNSIEALLGSFPGHGYHNVRRPVVNTMNFAHLVSLSREWQGEPRCPHSEWGASPFLQGIAASGSKFLLNLHHGDVGNTVIVGPTGSGKSALLALLCSQHGRYRGSQVFAFDKGRSLQALTRARKQAAHYALGAEETPQLCPLADLDSEESRAWASEWLQGLFEELGMELTPAERNAVSKAVLDLAKATSQANQRTLSDLWAHMQGERLSEAFEYYTQGPGGRVLNGDSDSLRYSRLTTFEIEDLLHAGPKIYGPTLRYLFRQVELRLDGRPTLLLVDEAWVALENKQFASKLGEWLRTLRKKSCALVLATQSPRDLVDSSVAAAILQSCPTKIYGANPEATTGELRRCYEHGLGLKPQLVEQIARLTPKRDYLWVQGVRSRLFGLQLGPATLSFCGVSAKQDLSRMTELEAQYGKWWPREWLKERGHTEAAAAWESEFADALVPERAAS